MREFTTAVQASESDVEESYVEFKLDGRVMRAYQPTTGQLAFMMAAMGRGQTQEQRTAGVINIMMASLRDDDQDYFESRLLESDASKRISVDTIVQVFEFLVEEWFARPTEPPSNSATPEQPDGQKSKPRTTKSTSSSKARPDSST